MTHETILQAVSDVTGVSKEDMLMDSRLLDSRKGKRVFARQVLAELCYTYHPRDLKQIANFVNRGYPNVLHSVKTVRNDIERDKFRRDIYNKVLHELSRIKWHRTDEDLQRAITEDLSEVQYEYQDISSEALKFQTNKA